MNNIPTVSKQTKMQTQTNSHCAFKETWTSKQTPSNQRKLNKKIPTDVSYMLATF